MYEKEYDRVDSELGISYWNNIFQNNLYYIQRQAF